MKVIKNKKGISKWNDLIRFSKTLIKLKWSQVVFKQQTLNSNFFQISEQLVSNKTEMSSIDLNWGEA
jgi:hypothetical protein